MTYIDTYINRIKGRYSPQLETLQGNLEAISDENVEELLEVLEASVSQGFFGLAAELTDRIGSLGREVLDRRHHQRIRLEIERMRRSMYMGFEEGTKVASYRCLELLNRQRTDRNHEAVNLWAFTAYSFRAWMTQERRTIQEALAACEAARDRINGTRLVRYECSGFIHGLRGRLAALNGNKEKSQREFVEGISLLEAEGFAGSAGYLKVFLAEHLALCDAWNGACAAARSFLRTASESGLKSHLVLRALLVLLQAPQDAVPRGERTALSVKAKIWLYALGLVQSMHVYPMLSAVRVGLQRDEPLDILEVESLGGLREFLISLSWREMEDAIAAHYRGLGYKVEKTVEGTSAFDLVATLPVPPDGCHTMAIQVKHRKGLTTKSDIPDEVTLREGADSVAEPLSEIVWFCSMGLSRPAQQLLQERVNSVFGSSCKTRVQTLDDLVHQISSQPRILARILFAKGRGGG